MLGNLPSLLKPVVLISIIFAHAALVTYAQQRPDPRVQPVVLTLPNSEKVTTQRDVTFKTIDGATLKMDIYYPPNFKTGKLPVVLFLNGVGILDLKDWRVYVDWGKLTAASGMIAITHQSRNTDTAADIADLISYVRSNAASLKIDENRIGIWSSSANVRIALPIVMQEDRKYIRSAVFYYGVMNSEKVRFDLPMLVARAGQDVPNINGTIDAYVARAIAQDAPLTLISYSEGQHAFDVLDNNEESREIIKQTLDFLKFHLLKGEAPISASSRAPSPGRFVAMITNDGITKAMQAFEEGRKADPNAVLFRENVLNGIGYQMLQDSRIREALEIFKQNATLFPQSANVYDSLGDAYEANGNTELAIQSAEKALELIVSDTTTDGPGKAAIRASAQGKLERLKEKK
jgi:tetratricopeptide (TPR) repeat protein